MYSFDSRQPIRLVRILQYHLNTTFTNSSYVAFLSLLAANEIENPGSLAHSSLYTSSLLFQCNSTSSDELMKRPRLAAWRSVQQKMCGTAIR